MTNSNFYKKLNKLRAKIKEKRKQELYKMINDEKNQLEDKIALIKMSFKELDQRDMVNSFKEFIKGDKKIPSISAASIIAKVSRDKFITTLAKKNNGYYRKTEQRTSHQ